MAEIRSTMDMVLERAERLAAAAKTTDNADDTAKIGMRMAADFLNGKEGDLSSLLASQSEGNRGAIRQGMIRTLLRNVVLPRERHLIESGKKALEAIITLAGQAEAIYPVCRELGQLLDQYEQHKEQSIRQLEDAIRAQLGQGRGGGEQGGDVNPAMHPQYREELNRMLTSLNNQYTQAFEQRKQMILSHLQ